jgi:hypothetical protein
MTRLIVVLSYYFLEQSERSKRIRNDVGTDERSRKPKKPKTETENLFGRVLVSFETFKKTKPSNLPTRDLQRQYEQYKIMFGRKCIQLFFDHFRQEEWLIELHHPNVLIQKNNLKTVGVKQSQSRFFSALNNLTPIMMRVYDCPPSQRRSSKTTPQSSGSLSCGSLGPFIILRDDSSTLGDDPESFKLIIFIYINFSSGHTLPPNLLLHRWRPRVLFPSHLPYPALFIPELPDYISRQFIFEIASLTHGCLGVILGDVLLKDNETLNKPPQMDGALRFNNNNNNSNNNSNLDYNRSCYQRVIRRKKWDRFIFKEREKERRRLRDNELETDDEKDEIEIGNNYEEDEDEEDPLFSPPFFMFRKVWIIYTSVENATNAMTHFQNKFHEGGEYITIQLHTPKIKQQRDMSNVLQQPRSGIDNVLHRLNNVNFYSDLGPSLSLSPMMGMFFFFYFYFYLLLLLFKHFISSF